MIYSKILRMWGRPQKLEEQAVVPSLLGSVHRVNLVSGCQLGVRPRPLRQGILEIGSGISSSGFWVQVRVGSFMSWFTALQRGGPDARSSWVVLA